MQELIAKIPPVSVASFAAIFNLLIAYQKFARDFRSPFFTPWKSWGFWVWFIVQASLPMGIFWLLYPTSLTPPITQDSIFKAITVGFGFTAFVNANIDLGFAGIPLDKLYGRLNQIASNLIASQQTRKLAEFTTDLETELTEPTATLNAGLTYLTNYIQQDFALQRDPVEQKTILDRITQTKALNNPLQKAQSIVPLILEIRSRDCLATLKRFGCRDSFLQTYFPKSTKKKP
jgi:hypothetical protein